ncbi:MAG: xylose isomerase [Verrucomicrobiota bacterium]|nr:xylose isomerase [Verrucomicrobiota bacterium]
MPLRKPIKPPELRQFANVWTMLGQPSSEKEWTMEQRFRQAKKEGFDAVGWGVIPEAAKLCKALDMTYVCYIDAHFKTFKDRLEMAADTEPARINVQLADHDTLPVEAVEVWIKMVEVAETLGLTIDLEVHRDTCTETPEKTWEIAKRYKEATGKKLRLSFDYSHFALVKHLSPPYAKRLLEHPELVRVARQMHFRPFNGHHCQIPVTNGKGKITPEFTDYLQFVDDLFACWFAGAKGGEILYVCPELGPRGGYGLSTFPNVWKDACLLRGETETLWKKHLALWKKQ